MIEVFGLLWLRPWFLALVPAALILGVVLARRSRDLGAWETAIDPALMTAMRRFGRVSGGAPRRAWLPALVIAALGIALAGPGVERRDTASFRNLDAVVLVLDLSPSLTEGDHLFEALTAARLIVESAGTRQTGLIVYAGEAYVAAPLTADVPAMMGTLALIDGQTMPVEGTNPAAGLARAEALLADAAILSGDVVLISDGAGLTADALASAQRLAAAGLPVSALQVGPGTPDLDALVRAGGGILTPLTDPFPLARRIGARAVTRLAETDYAMLVIRDLGRWVLLLALAGALFLLPRKGTA